MNPDTVELDNGSAKQEFGYTRVPDRVWESVVVRLKRDDEKIREQEKAIQGLLAELNDQDERTKKLLRRADKGLRRAARKRRRHLREISALRDFKTIVMHVNKDLLASVNELKEKVNHQPPNFLDRMIGWFSWGLR